MNQNFESAIPMGKYMVSPATRQTSTGRYRASIAMQRAQGKGAYCRVFNFNGEFTSREAARTYAIRQGWVEAGFYNTGAIAFAPSPMTHSKPLLATSP
jgi:hypothetical protein